MLLKTFSTRALSAVLGGMMFEIPWTLKKLEETEKNGLKVFSCFHCGGGSTMGYKLAGYEVLGGVEIDPEMMGIYRKNHNPKHSFLMGVQQFNKTPNSELPRELFNLDILDGSPPCSSFSIAGAREKKWGVKTHFREGQAEQVLDDLFFHFIETARKLQPKVVIAENVKGLVIGKAKGYVKQIKDMFNLAGYDLQLFLLNSAFMGVPQKRERTFFVARKKDLKFKDLKIETQKKPKRIKEVFSGINLIGEKIKTPGMLKLWNAAKPGTGAGEGGLFNAWKKLNPEEPSFTLTGSTRHFHWEEKAVISDDLIKRIQSFPDDFDFLKTDAQYVCGMSVPPVMMANLSKQVERQWFKNG